MPYAKEQMRTAINPHYKLVWEGSHCALAHSYHTDCPMSLGGANIGKRRCGEGDGVFLMAWI